MYTTGCREGAHLPPGEGRVHTYHRCREGIYHRVQERAYTTGCREEATYPGRRLPTQGGDHLPTMVYILPTRVYTHLHTLGIPHPASSCCTVLVNGAAVTGSV